MITETDYVSADHSAALRDLIALRGQKVTFAGKTVSAYVQNESSSADADDAGAGDFHDEKTLSFELPHGVAVSATEEVKIKGKSYRITSYEDLGGGLFTISVDLA